MNKLYALAFAFSLSVVAYAIEPDWQFQKITDNANLQKMEALNSSDAVIAGYGATLKKTTDFGASYQNIEVLLSQYGFNDLSFIGNKGFVVASRTKMVDNPAGGYPDVNVNGMLLHSVDFGSTWDIIYPSQIGTGDDPNTNPNAKESACDGFDPTCVAYINDTLVFLGARWYDYNGGDKETKNAVFRSLDGGLTFSFVYDAQDKYVNTITTVNQTILIGGNKLAVSSGDFGESFIDHSTGLMESIGDEKGFFVSSFTVSGDYVYITTTSDGVHKTVDGGVSFQKMAGLTGGNQFIEVDVNTMYVVGSNTKNKLSTDGGKTWMPFSPGLTIYNAKGPYNDKYYLLAKGKYFTISSEDLKAGLKNFVEVSFEYDHNFKNIAFNGQDVLLCGLNKMLYKSSDAAATWNTATPDLYAINSGIDFMGLSMSDDKNGIASSLRLKYADFSGTAKDLYHPGVIYTTTDGWKTTKLLDAKNIGAAYGDDITKNPAANGGIRFDPREVLSINATTFMVYAKWEDTVSVAGTFVKHGRLFKTKNGGDDWTVVSSDFEGNTINVLKRKERAIYAGGLNEFVKSSDEGDTFADIYANMSDQVTGSAYISDIHVGSENDLIVTTTTDGIFNSTDGGTTFSKYADLAGATSCIRIGGNTLLALGTSSKSKYSRDNGLTWEGSYPGHSVYRIGPIWNDTVYAMTKSGIFKSRVGAVTPVAEPFADLNELKVIARIGQLDITLGGAPIDDFQVFNMKGQLIDQGESGASRVTVNNGFQNQGVYLVRVQSKGQTYTQKVLVR